MSGMTGCEPLSAEQTKKAEVINDRLNAISLETRSNLNTMLQINSILLGSDLACEGKSEKEPKTVGWFNNVIDMLKMIGANNMNLKKELDSLRNEFRK